MSQAPYQWGGARVGLRQRGAFIVCVFILGLSAGGLSVAKAKGWLRIIKAAAPLRKPLIELSEAGPFVLHKEPRLTEETENELGTREYAFWSCTDPSAGERDPQRVFALSVTYYTGKPDQVPHVPEECHFQGGREQVSLDDYSIKRSDGRELPLRRLLFRDADGIGGVAIYYTFSVNNDYHTDRQMVRLRMNDSSETHLYYSKVEVTYWVPSMREAKREALDGAAQRVFDWVIPVLEREHWPDMKTLHADKKRAPEKASVGDGNAEP
ncbi:MAG: hypothetical protein HUU22_09080 [Phycisphaerae bacterium]|nr:hypothetical protein [Phycisphaerae bacterium]NUQ46175.1 hypothetical protein [Phycisphaerae bacterium]